MAHSGPPSPPRWSRRGGRLRRLLTTAGLVFLAVYTVAFFELNDRRLGSLITWAVTRSVRGTFTIGRAHYDYGGGLWSILTNQPTHVVGGDFEMLDPDGNLVMRVPHVDAEIHLRELIGSLIRYGVTRHFHLTLHFASGSLPGGYAVIAPTRSTFGSARSEMNIVAAMSAKKPSTDDQGDFSISVDHLDLAGVDFAIASSNTDGQLSWIGRLDDAKGKARLTYSSAKRRATPDGPFFFFELDDIDVHSGKLQLGDFLFPLADLHVVHFGTVPSLRAIPSIVTPAGWGPRQVLAFQAHATSLEGKVTASGALVDAYSAHPGVQLRIDLEHGRRLASLLPEPIAGWIGGDPHGAVLIAGPFTDVSISGSLEGAEVSLAGMHLKNAGGHMRLSNDATLHLDQLHGDLARGRVRGKVDVRLAEHGTFRVELDASGVDPGELPAIPVSLRPILAGRFGGHVRLGGGFGQRAEAADAIDVQVTAATLERSAVDKLPRKLELSGTVDWREDRVGLRGVAMQGDGLAVEASGSVHLGRTPTTALDFTASAVPGAWLSRVGLPGDLQIERGVAHGSVAGPFLGLEGSATLEVLGLVVRGRRIDHVSAGVSLRGGRLRIDELVGEGVGAHLMGSGALRLFEVDASGRTRLDRRLAPEIDARLKADGANLSEVFGTIAVSGKGDLDVALSGALATPTGHASITVPEVSLLGDRYRNGRLAFDFSDQGAKVSALHLQRVDGGQLEGTGAVGWTGALDLNLRPRAFPLAAIPGVASLPVSILGTLSGDVHLGGDLGQPQPGGVISLVGAKIRDTFFGDGSVRLEPGADAIHITGKFFERYSVEGYLTLYPKISVAVTVQFKDVELEKIFPEMRKLAEVRGKATGEARITADAEGGLTFAGLKIGELSLVLSGIDETGHARRLVVRNQEEVTLSTDGRELTVDRCYLRSVLGGFAIHGRISQKASDVELKGKIGLELMEYFFTSFFQHMHGDAMVDLRVRGDLTRPALLGSLDLRRATLVPRGLEGHKLFVPSGIIDFEPDGVRLKSLKIDLDGSVAQASGRIALSGYTPGAIEGDVSGDLSAKFLQWVLPDQIDEASGALSIKIHLGGSWQRPEWRGQARVKDMRFSLRRTGREVAVNAGTFRFVNYDIAIGCAGNSAGGECGKLSGLIDDESRFSMEGTLGFGEKLSLRALSLRADATDLGYSGGDVSVRVSPSLQLSGDGKHLDLEGVVNVVEGRYTAKIDLVGLLLSAHRTVERAQPFWEGIPLLEQMGMDLRAKSTGPFVVRNDIFDLSVGADLRIGGTLAEPSFGGEATIEGGGTINIPGCRFPFLTNPSQLTFDPEKRYPATPNVQLSATGVLVSDRTDSSQNVNVQMLGPLAAFNLNLSTQQGVQGTDVIFMCLTGKTADEIRRGASPGTTGGTGRAPSLGGVQGTTTTEGVAKSATGALVAGAIDPLRKIARLDTLSLEFGATGVDVRACKRWTRGLKTCGLGEIGFVGGTRVGGVAEYRISDSLSLLGRGEYLTRGIETAQESLTRGRLELDLKLPLIW